MFFEARNISKVFGSVRANDSVDLKIRENEIHCIVGENGAGKSTLMKILYGMQSPDSGELFFKDQAIRFNSSLDALERGIGMVHQHFMLVGRLSVVENLVLGAEPMRGAKIDYEGAEKDLVQLIEKANAHLKASDFVADLSVGEQQRLEIIRLLYRKSECLIFDEPTAVLTPQEVEAFLESLKELRKQNKTIILITHKLSEVFKVADRITVMRGGRTVGERETAKTSKEEITQLMVGRSVDLSQRPARRKVEQNTSRLKVSNLKTGKLEGISFEIKAGEILGLAGIEGSGQSEICELIWGLRKLEAGQIEFDGKTIENLSVNQRKKLGISYVPEDRHEDSIILDLDLISNFYLGQDDVFGSKTFTPRAKVSESLLKAKSDYEIKFSHVSQKIRGLSGGNQQKLVIARELLRNPKLLIAAQPTRGVDIGAIERIHQELMLRRDQGVAILLVSCELDELLRLSDRILVMKGHRQSAIFDDINIDSEQLRYSIGAAML